MRLGNGYAVKDNEGGNDEFAVWMTVGTVNEESETDTRPLLSPTEGQKIGPPSKADFKTSDYTPLYGA